MKCRLRFILPIIVLIFYLLVIFVTPNDCGHAFKVLDSLNCIPNLILNTLNIPVSWMIGIVILAIPGVAVSVGYSFLVSVIMAMLTYYVIGFVIDLIVCKVVKRK